MFCSLKSIFNQTGEVILQLDRQINDSFIDGNIIISLGWNSESWYIYHDQILIIEIPMKISNGFINNGLIFIKSENIGLYTKYGQLIQEYPINSSICKNLLILPNHRFSINKQLLLKSQFIEILYFVDKSSSTIQKIELDVNGILNQVHVHLSECVQLKHDLNHDEADRKTELITKSIAQYILLGHNPVMSFYIQTHVTIQSYQKHLQSLVDLFEQWNAEHLSLKDHLISLISKDKQLFAYTMSWGEIHSNQVLQFYNKQISTFDDQHAYFISILEYFNWIVHLVEEKPYDADVKKLILFCKRYNSTINTIQLVNDENKQFYYFDLPHIEVYNPTDSITGNLIECTINDDFIIMQLDGSISCNSIEDKIKIPYEYKQGVIRFNGKVICNLLKQNELLILYIIGRDGIVLHESTVAKSVYQYDLKIFDSALMLIINNSVFTKTFQDLLS